MRTSPSADGATLHAGATAFSLMPRDPEDNRQPGVTPDTNGGSPRLQPALVARPDSPVGRTNELLRSDPSARDPLRGLDIDLTRCTDMQLHELVSRLLEEKHRRAARWLTLVPQIKTITEEPTP